MNLDTITKDPDEVETYTINWSTNDVLDSGETISTSTVSFIDTGPVINSQSNTDTTSTFALSGGTVGSYVMKCVIVTSNLRTLETRFRLKVKDSGND